MSHLVNIDGYKASQIIGVILNRFRSHIFFANVLEGQITDDECVRLQAGHYSQRNYRASSNQAYVEFLVLFKDSFDIPNRLSLRSF